ncbi:MAG: hypothetical protein MSG64_18940 [Pyrinomonadaceae bacterium MAG19_C2-C3]|nr:hypothetical protein [Pyrinomonadaceae bacterium MAG19_C2-C3]
MSSRYERSERDVLSESTLSEAGGKRANTRTFNAAGEVKTDRVQGGVLDGVQTSVAYDLFLRRDFLQASRGATVLMSQTYGYDSSSRLQTITGNNQTATYAYHPNGLLNTTSYAGGMSVARSYDQIGRLTAISTATSSGILTN